MRGSPLAEVRRPGTAVASREQDRRERRPRRRPGGAAPGGPAGRRTPRRRLRGAAGVILRPHAASSAGTRVRPAASATSTVAMPPMASEVNVGSPKANRPASDAMTVSAEKVIVRPAVPIVRIDRGVSTSAPAARSSRNRLTISRL